MRFMEQDGYPSDEYGNEIAQELYKRIQAFPDLASVIIQEVIHLYAQKINRTCDQYEFSHIRPHSERECV